MTTIGEIAFEQFLINLQQRVSTRYVTCRDVQNIGSFFWSLLKDEFKEEKREETGRNAFWVVAQSIKKCLINNDIESIAGLWGDFYQNGKYKFENLYDDCLKCLVHEIL